MARRVASFASIASDFASRVCGSIDISVPAQFTRLFETLRRIFPAEGDQTTSFAGNWSKLGESKAGAEPIRSARMTVLSPTLESGVEGEAEAMTVMAPVCVAWMV